MVRGRASSEDSSAEVSVEFVTNYLASLDEQDSDTDDDGSPVATQVRDVRKRVWTTWNRYTAKNTNITARFWIDFARFPHRKELRNAIRAFMRVCVEESKTFQVVLGPEERIKARTINSAHSLIQVLRALVAAADAKVLKPERQALRDMGKHDEAARLFLRWDQQNERREGPAFETVSWILNKLAKELNLQIEPTYAKVEATAEDIIVVLLTLYHRAEDIPAPTPITRISFHAALLISAAGGCRPGMVMGLKCKHFALSMVRDPKDKARTRIVVTVTIPRNKQLRDISCRTTGRNKPPVQYSSPLLPFPVLCLASLVIARALQMGAIETSLQSAHELFRRPVLGSVDVIPIKWKADFEERDLFPLTYPQFRSLWAKCVMVMGCRKPIRPYALRVGAGNRMDDQLSGALRNYVMSHTSDVFETAYQTSHVRVNLPGIAFGEDNVDRDEELFSNLRKMSLTSDDGAPISVPREEIRKFDERQDMKDFLAKLDICLPQEKMKLRSKMANRKAVLTKLQLEANRQSYFEQADRLRLHGRQPTHSSGTGGPGDAAQLAAFLSKSKSLDKRLLDTGFSEEYIEALMNYLCPRPHMSPVPKNGIPDNSATSTVDTRSCCYICFSKLKDRSSLTRHFKDKHLNDGTFQGPITCSDCRRSGATATFFDGPEQWCNHLEHTHGIAHTPAYPGVSSHDSVCALSSLSCLLCSATLARSALIRHINQVEIPKLRRRQNPCQLCAIRGEHVVELSSAWEFMEHARTTHGWDIAHEPCLICGQLCSPGSGFQKHCSSAHKDLDHGQHCGACEVSAPLNGRQLDSVEDLIRHAIEMHPSMRLRTDHTGRKRKRTDGDPGSAKKRVTEDNFFVDRASTEGQVKEEPAFAVDGKSLKTWTEKGQGTKKGHDSGESCSSPRLQDSLAEREFLSRVDPRLLTVE